MRGRAREPCRKPKKWGCINRIVNQIVNLQKLFVEFFAILLDKA